jgi:catechol-2,3-dioxygenase
MYRDVGQRQMTVAEAMHLSEFNGNPLEKFERPSVWSWQTVARAMAQAVTPEQLAAMAKQGVPQSRTLTEE